MLKNINPYKVKFAPDYIRAGVSTSKVKEYVDIARSAMIDDPKIGFKEEKWPFPPVTGYVHADQIIINDGRHRILAARLCSTDKERTWIPVNVVSFKSPALAFVNQYTSNLHGIPLSRDERNNAISKMRSMKITEKEISKLTSLTQSAISRILKKKGHKKGPQGSKNRKGNGKTTNGKKINGNGNEPKNAQINPEVFLEHLSTAVLLFKDEGRDIIINFLKKKAGVGVKNMLCDSKNMLTVLVSIL